MKHGQHINRYDVARTDDGVSVVLTTHDGERIWFDADAEVGHGLGLAIEHHARPDDDALLSVPEAADAIGISYRALHQRTTMPAPDVDVPDGRSGRRLRFWWRSTLDRAGVIAAGNRREAGEGDFMGLFWAIVLLGALGKGCGIG